MRGRWPDWLQNCLLRDDVGRDNLNLRLSIARTLHLLKYLLLRARRELTENALRQRTVATRLRINARLHGEGAENDSSKCSCSDSSETKFP
jgi:hypothetical protein